MKNEDSSSLELLLDTMCNTFGGVMFIAITLAVVLFSKNALQNTTTPQERSRQRQEEMLRQIEELRQQLKEAMQKQQEMAERALLLEKDPRMKSLTQIAVLEQMAEKAKCEQEILAKQRDFLNGIVVKADAQVQQMTAEKAEMDGQILALTEKLKSQEACLEALAAEAKKTKAMTMAFTVLEEHNDKMPYFIMLKGGRLWRVGPTTQADDNGILLPEEDVSYVVKDNIVCCIPLPDHGFPALDGDNLSSQCQKLLKDMPDNRGAVFSFGPEDAETFYQLREILKKKKLFHGFSVQENSDTMIYSFGKAKAYEY